MLPATQISRTPIVGVSSCKKCLGTLLWWNSKVSKQLLWFFLAFWMLVDRLSVLDSDRWAVTSWAIWNVRNKYYFERIQTHPKSILNGALRFLQEYQNFMATQRHTWDTVFFLVHKWYRDFNVAVSLQYNMIIFRLVLVVFFFFPCFHCAWIGFILTCTLVHINNISIFYLKKKKKKQ